MMLQKPLMIDRGVMVTMTMMTHDRNPHHQYVNPTKNDHSIFGGKVSLESKRERKLLKRACLSVINTDVLISNPRLPA
jgi:hypothetical protein